MIPRPVFLALLLAGLAAAGESTAKWMPGEAQAPQSLLYMTSADWTRATRAEKLVLSADFMRVFCVQPTMSPESLADCLDEPARGPVPFDKALACIKTLQDLAN
jgi:hypothetical protein